MHGKMFGGKQCSAGPGPSSIPAPALTTRLFLLLPPAFTLLSPKDRKKEGWHENVSMLRQGKDPIPVSHCPSSQEDGVQRGGGRGLAKGAWEGLFFRLWVPLCPPPPPPPPSHQSCPLPRVSKSTGENKRADHMIDKDYVQAGGDLDFRKIVKRKWESGNAWHETKRRRKKQN